MSGRAAKVARRNLMRIVGQSGVAAVEQQGAILGDTVMPSLEQLHILAKDTDRRLNELEAFRNRCFKDRLFWVLLGE